MGCGQGSVHVANGSQTSTNLQEMLVKLAQERGTGVLKVLGADGWKVTVMEVVY